MSSRPKHDRVTALVEKLSDFECAAGPLHMNSDFRELLLLARLGAQQLALPGRIEEREYAGRDIVALDKLGGFYSRHVAAMTAEGLHSKSSIAAELAWRDYLLSSRPAPQTQDQEREALLAYDFEAAEPKEPKDG